MTDTIFALSSGAGRAAVAVIRLSGPGCRVVWDRMTRLAILPRVARHAVIRRPTSGEILDRGLAIFFAAPNSFTGEDMVEFQTHGSRAVVKELLQVLGQTEGLRIADPGEFTRRAFENGKLTLASAEGLADLIDADTNQQRRQALAHMENPLARAAGEWREQLLSALALIEAQIDFPDEDDAPVDVTDDVRAIIVSLRLALDKAIASHRASEIVREGYTVLIAGPPNAGKSTLLNRLAQREVAITSDTPGTTRDLIEVQLDLQGLSIVLVDTAGVRDTNDTLERMGIDRALRRSQGAELVLWLAPMGTPPPQVPPEFEGKATTVRTKIDLGRDCEKDGTIAISATDGSGIEDLLAFIHARAQEGTSGAHDGLILRERHLSAASELHTCLEQALVTLGSGQFELTAEDLRRGAIVVSRLADDILVDDILDQIFTRFCLGK